MTATRPTYALDASFGVKWFRTEQGSDDARRLFDRAVEGEVALVAPVHFVHELLSVVGREFSSAAMVEAWQRLEAAGITLIPLTDEVVAEAARQCDLLGCSFYDALAPACAAILGATLASADARAHGDYPDLLLIE